MINQYEINLPLIKIVKAFCKIFSSKERKNLEKFFYNQLNKNSIAVGSGSDAIYIALQDIKRKKGVGEVIISNYSCKAIPNAVIKAGFKLVFVDIDDSISMNINEVKKAINKETKVIIPYHPWGFIHNQNVFEIAKKKNIIIIEDCAQSFAKINGKLIGRNGDYSFFSFRTGKLIHAGSGAVLCSNKQLNIKLKKYPLMLSFANLFDLLIRKITNIPKIKATIDYFFDKISAYKIGNAEAFLALQQIKNLEKIAEKRRENYRYLEKIVKKTKFKIINFNKCEAIPSNFPILTEKKELCIKLFKQKGINATSYYNHVNSKIFNGRCIGYKNSEKIAKTIINLPVHEALSRKDLNKIAEAIKYVNNKI